MALGYHFTGDTLRDGRPIPAVGETLRHDGAVVMCESGLHWSEHPFDALAYAPGPFLHRVECSVPLFSEDDKHVSRERTILATVDTTRLLRRFAADQALSVSHLWDMPEVVRTYLTTLDEAIRDTAWDAAWGAACDAAWGAACDAAWGAARDAARDAARAAAWVAARVVEEDATRVVARVANDVVWIAAWSATGAGAGAAARGAACDAAWDAARREFSARVEKAFS